MSSNRFISADVVVDFTYYHARLISFGRYLAIDGIALVKIFQIKAFGFSADYCSQVADILFFVDLGNRLTDSVGGDAFLT